MPAHGHRSLPRRRSAPTLSVSIHPGLFDASRRNAFWPLRVPDWENNSRSPSTLTVTLWMSARTALPGGTAQAVSVVATLSPWIAFRSPLILSRGNGSGAWPGVGPVAVIISRATRASRRRDMSGASELGVAAIISRQEDRDKGLPR